MFTQKQRVLGILVTSILLSLACAVPGMQSPALPTLPPGGINTIIAMTAGAAQTQTAAVLPAASPTPLPSFTPTKTVIPPTETPTPTETVIFSIIKPTSTKAPATSKPSSSSGTTTDKYTCSLVAQTPSNNTKFDPGAKFDVAWKVKNTGNKVWDKGSVDFIFKGGQNLASISGYDLPGDVPVNGTITLTLQMTAPNDSGTYTSNWALRRGKTNFCVMSVKIVVK